MHPQESFGFAADELGKIVFFNRSAYNKPVKTAIFLGGMEYEAWTRRDRGRGGLDPCRLPEPGPEVYRSVAASAVGLHPARARARLGPVPRLGAPGGRGRPGVCVGRHESGAAVPAFMRDGERALAALNLSLALQTLVALERAGLARGTEVFTEGGFRKNAGYNAVLAAALPSEGRQGAYLTDMAEATAFGAAMTAAAALEGTSPTLLGDRFDIDYTTVRPMEASVDLGRLLAAAWLALVAGSNGRKQA